jgi:hypothetical protein
MEVALHMAKHDELFIVYRPEQKVWAIEKPHAERASDLKPTQEQAIKRAKQLAPEGSIHLKGLNGKLKPIQKGS